MSVGPKEMRRIRDDFECDGQVDYDQTAALIAALDEANAKLKELEYANEMRRQVIAVIEPRLESAEAKLERVREAIAFDPKHGPLTEWGMATALADVKRALAKEP